MRSGQRMIAFKHLYNPDQLLNIVVSIWSIYIAVHGFHTLHQDQLQSFHWIMYKYFTALKCMLMIGYFYLFI